jgi:hypothetical protein
MKPRLIFFLPILLCCLSASAQVTITPATPPAVNAGQTVAFTANVAVTWSCPGCRGSINPTTGVYTAPASISSSQSYGGYQVLPNDHIYNTRIDSLPVGSNSNSWIAGSGTVPLNYLPSFPINYTDGSTPTQNMIFNYTPANNGLFQIPAYPNARIESGWFSAPFAGMDRHLLAIDTTTGVFQEMYNLYTPGANTSCATCTSQSGVKYSSSSYALPTPTVDAAGLLIMPLTLRLQELENAVASGGTIKHALRFTLQSGYCASSFIWPATSYATDGGTVPFGARFRLKAGFNIASFSPIAQVLLKQLQQYGIVLSDGGYGWQVTTELTRWPSAYQAAFDEIRNASIAPANFEAVDESSLMVSANSGATTASETVVATSTANPAQNAKRQVVLTGVTVTLPSDAIYVQAGAEAQQLTAFAKGSANNGLIWSMSPSVGSLTTGGLYTPPVSANAAASTTITATSAADATAKATMSLTVFPGGTMRIINGRTSAYTDSQGNVWQPMTGDDGGYPYDNGGSWPNVPDIYLYQVPYYALDGMGSDMTFAISVPNGTYSITAKFAATNVSGAGQESTNLETQGRVVYSNVDMYAAAGGLNKPIDFTLPATVTNGKLSFVLRHVTGNNFVSAVQIVPQSLTGSPSRPAPPSGLQIQIQ